MLGWLCPPFTHAMQVELKPLLVKRAFKFLMNYGSLYERDLLVYFQVLFVIFFVYDFWAYLCKEENPLIHSFISFMRENHVCQDSIRATYATMGM